MPEQNNKQPAPEQQPPAPQHEANQQQVQERQLPLPQVAGQSFVESQAQLPTERDQPVETAPAEQPAGSPSIGGAVQGTLFPLAKAERPTFRQRLSAFFDWFKKPESLAVCAIAAAILAVHIVNIASPSSWDTNANPPTRKTIGDEVYYVAEASHILKGEPTERPEHPPLGKWIIAGGMLVFGDNAVGWRSSPILFGMVSIFIFYFICKRLVRREVGNSGTGELSPPAAQSRFARWLEMSVYVPVLATFLFATENMSFVMGHAAMLDVFYVTFMLLGFLLFLRGNNLASGAAMGLSTLCKAMAFLAMLAIPLYWAIARRDEVVAELKYTWNALRGRKGVPSAHSEILGMMKLAAAVSVVWLVGLTLLEYGFTHHWANPIGRTAYMLTTHLSLNDSGYGSTTGVASMPWKWIIMPTGWYLYYTPRYLSAVGWTVWALIMPSIAYLLYEVVRGRVRGHTVAVFALSWFAGTYGLLVLLKVVAHRLMYTFYFYPSIAAVCLAVAWGSWKLWGIAKGGPKTRVIFLAGLGVYLLGTIATFIIMGPFGTNLVKLPTSG